MKALTSRIVTLLVLVLLSLSGSYAQGRSRVLSRPCPFSCGDMHSPSGYCRNWQKGNWCYVETYQNTFAGPRPVARPAHPGHMWGSLSDGAVGIDSERGYSGSQDPWRSSVVSSPSSRAVEGARRCRELAQNYMSRPYINVHKVYRTARLGQNEYYVRGSLEGICLVEGGYFENDRKARGLPLRTSPEFERYEFEIVVDGDRRPEIRVYNVNGDREVYQVRETMRQ